MKKIIALIFTGLMIFGMCACGGESSDGGQQAAGDAYYFEVKGTKIAMNAAAADIISALGEPKEYFESESCAFKGLDKQYQYGSYTIYTYPKDEVDYISQVALLDDTLNTPEGICIGSTVDQVKAAYGEPTSTTASGNFEYDRADSQLVFIFADGTVNSIQYYAVTEIN